MTTFDWLREINPNLRKLDSIPLTGNVPPFPWKDFSEGLARSLDVKEIPIQPGIMTWRPKEEIYEGIGDDLLPLTFAIPTLKGQFTWIMAKQEVILLATLLFTKDTHPLLIAEPAFIDGFYRFLALEALYHFTQSAFDSTLSPTIAPQASEFNQDCLCWDISFQLQNHPFLGRLLFPTQFLSSWSGHFAKREDISAMRSQMAKIVDVTAHLEAGKTQLTLADWKSVRLGDFIILDSCSLDPSDHFNGLVTLTIRGKKAFRGKLKDGTLNILELPLLDEVETTMAKQPEEDEEDHLDDFDDLDFTDLSDDSDVSDDSDISDDSDVSDESSDVSDESKDEKEDRDFFSEDDFFDEKIKEEKAEIETTEVTETPVEEVLKETELPAAEAPVEPESQLFKAELIPVTLVVEVGQVQMTMEKLLSLAPGNLLEINLHPENHVDLTINGKTVGKGELIKIGEAIGVRVLELGSV